MIERELTCIGEVKEIGGGGCTIHLQKMDLCLVFITSLDFFYEFSVLLLQYSVSHDPWKSF